MLEVFFINRTFFHSCQNKSKIRLFKVLKLKT